MTLIRWNPTLNPAREVATFQDEVNKMFDSFFSRSGLRAAGMSLFAPAVDIEETAESFVVRADLPGVSQKDIRVNLMGDTLTIRGERKQEEATKEGTLCRVERVFGTFERSFTLGTPVRNDKVKAQYKDGVLEVTIPKAEEAKLREIEVQVASA